MPSTPMTDAAQVGKVQALDLKTIWETIRPEEVPFLSSLKTESDLCNGPLNEWLSETFPVVDSTATPDGEDVDEYERQERYNIQAYVHSQRASWKVTQIANANRIGGGINRNEKGRQKMKALMRLRLKLEQQFLGSSELAADNGTTGYTGRGSFKWLETAAQATLPVDSALRPSSACNYTGAFSSITEETLVDQLNAMYLDVRARQEFDLFCGLELKNLIDKFTLVHPVSSATSQPKVQYVRQDVSKYGRNVELLDISSAMVRVHLAHQVDYTQAGAANTYSTKSGVILNLDMWSLQDLIPLHHEDLPNLGGGPRGYYERVVLLKCGNPKGQGYIKPTS